MAATGRDGEAKAHHPERQQQGQQTLISGFARHCRTPGFRVYSGSPLMSLAELTTVEFRAGYKSILNADKSRTIWDMQTQYKRSTNTTLRTPDPLLNLQIPH